MTHQPLLDKNTGLSIEHTLPYTFKIKDQQKQEILDWISANCGRCSTLSYAWRDPVYEGKLIPLLFNITDEQRWDYYEYTLYFRNEEDAVFIKFKFDL